MAEYGRLKFKRGGWIWYYFNCCWKIREY